MFDQWWNLYDKKEGREPALKSWNKLTEPEKNKCLSIVEEYVKSKPDKQYRPMASTYLNQKRFNDQIEPKELIKPKVEAPVRREVYPREYNPDDFKVVDYGR